MANAYVNGILRDSSGNVVTVDSASVSAPVSEINGFLRDSTGALVTTGSGGGGGSSYYQTVEVGGTAETQRAAVNLIAGSNVTITAADNAGSNRTDVTIASSGGGGASAGTVVPLGNISGTVVCDLSLGVCFTGTQTGNVTVNFTNWPASPALTEPLLIFNQGTGGFTITIAGVTWEPYGTGPTWDTTAGDVNVIPLSSPDQGAHIYGQTGASSPVDPINALKTQTVFLGYTASAGTWAVTPNTSCLLCGQLTNSTQATGDSVSFPITLSAGTWTVEAILHKGPALGIVTAELDGVTIGTWDGYAASNTFNFVVAFTGVVVSTSGLHTLLLTSTTKNASATAYAIKVSQLSFQRTA